jgi:hypothetical protein
MALSSRLGAASLLALVAVLSSACGDLPAPRTCSAASPCPSGAWCRSDQCVANAAPVAVIEAPAAASSNRPLVFHGGGIHDADPGDVIASWKWSVSAPDGTTACDPQPTAASGPDLTVIFPCAGDHRVTLTVTDSMGLASTPRTATVRVDPTLDPPQVSVGADVSVGHRCAGTPVACNAGDAPGALVALSAAGAVPVGSSFTYRWTADPPPELAGQPAPRITFSPSATSASPQVSIETAGTAIAGRYVFVVEATDSRGMIAIGRQRVDVGNRPPVVTGGGPLALPHAYEPATRTFVATGATPALAWTDPDGDPVAPIGFTSSHAGDGGNVLDVQDQGDHARVTVVVAFGKPSDAAFLIGPDVRRRVELWVADVNGARASGGFDVTVTNRPPRVAAAVGSHSVDHAYDAAGQRYVAQAALSTWVDDDGDPLSLAVSGDPLCATVEERQGTAWVSCALPYPGRPAVPSFAGTRTLTVSSRDPFDAGAAQATALEIRNRPPRVVTPSVSLLTSCSTVATCCATDPGTHGCLEPDFQYAPVSGAAPLLVDDDGDPLDVSLSPSGSCLSAAAPPQPCPAGGCTVGLSMCGARAACGGFEPTSVLTVAADDGSGRTGGDVAVTSSCR